MKNIKFYLSVFWQLVKTDLLIFKKTFVDDTIDIFIWLISVVGVVAYVFPKLGMSKNYGEFFAIGSIVSAALFQIWPATVSFINETTGNKSITYPLTLPLPSWMAIIKRAVSFWLKTMVITVMVLPVTKLMLWNRMDLSEFSFIRFVILFVTINAFAGLFTIFTTSLTDSIDTSGKVWMRIIFPLWFFGGTQFSWQTLYGISPKLAYLDLANPMLYAVEGIRAATQGQQGNLPFWICFMMLIIYGTFFGAIGVLRLKKRLDFV